MHRLRPLLFVILLLFGPLAAAAGEAELRLFARSEGIVDVEGFVETVESLRKTKKLPPRYLTKAEARKLGWEPGVDLCTVARARAIGGDRFGNREKRLPDKRDRKWFEADLDFFCGSRGPKRLVWSNDGLIYLTTDHYQTFKEVPK
ncbi:MAG: hypothetical protein NZ555_05190 [Geminicoccaceae bacterium]|nr:hypothetical protein [Geminicoccaceae bacterium]MCX8102180.1 hypothetical protein [Geminicoccaceae bacterium]MDW8370832.1 ribonuclease domain-containing protein [Geminicoccaceae bacterium]